MTRGIFGPHDTYSRLTHTQGYTNTDLVSYLWCAVNRSREKISGAYPSMRHMFLIDN